MSQGFIATEGLSRRFGHVWALNLVNLKIESGRIVALLGPNGAGKTTLLRLLMGLLEPTEGQSRLLGANSRSLPDAVTARVGYMGDLEEPPRWAKLRDLVALQAGVSAPFDRAGVEEFMLSRDLDLSRPYGTLSKGQKKWVRAGLILAGGADVLLMDEPAEGLDPSARQDLYDRLRRCVSQRDATAIVATHVISDIERVADDVALIDHGRLLAYAALEDLREQVRQIELPADEPVPVWPQEVDLLSRKVEGDVQLLWVRCRPGTPELEAVLPADAVIRGVGLERFYLAMMDNAQSGVGA
jgi:ABC-2 type transport system ATP-binding protein